MPANKSSQDLLRYLRINGPTPSSELVAHFGISRATLSRRVQDLGNAVITIGSARATQLAARHEDVSDSIPLYRVTEGGQVEAIGGLTPIREGEQTQWFLNLEEAPKALFEGEFKDGLYPGWPWFLEDLRPSGFLGRSFGKRMARLLQIKEKPEEWSDLELLATLTGFGSSLQGNFILGDRRALNDFQEHKVEISQGYYRNSTASAYSEMAQRALDEDEAYGSSAGGEQPKFTTMICDTTDSDPRAVIVKFSPKLDTPVGRRWADLLHAEHLANQVLADAGFAVARTRIFELQGRVFLESERFDRVGQFGRRGLVSLRALDAAHLGLGQGTWTKAARKLHADKWITEEDCERIVRLHCFGELIANTDMHWGNLSFFLPEQSPYPLAPIYDMLPMRFRPSGTGEVVKREFKPTLPKPEDQTAWLVMHPHALTFWQRIANHASISDNFKAIAETSVHSLEHIYQIATS